MVWSTDIHRIPFQIWETLQETCLPKKKVEKPRGDFASWLALTPPTFVRDICFSTQRSTFLNFWLEIDKKKLFFSVAMPQDSEKEKAVERRSLVGMPPTMKKSQSGAAAATPAARPQRKTI